MGYQIKPLPLQTRRPQSRKQLHIQLRTQKPEKPLAVMGRGAGWSRGGASTRFPPMWPRFDFRTRLEFVIGSRPCSEGFSQGSPVFPPSTKPPLLYSNSIREEQMKSHSVEMPMQIPIIIIISIIIIIIIIFIIIIINLIFNYYYNFIIQILIQSWQIL